MRNSKDFSTITELPNTMVTSLQLKRAHHRYMLASDYCDQGDYILEIACGGGQGLGILAENAKKVVGIDLDVANIKICQKSYESHKKVTALVMSAENLDFPDSNFDCIIVYEAIYYFQDVNRVFNEIGRVLKKGGKLIICTANKDWPEFNPSQFSTKYYSVPELKVLTENYGYTVSMYGAFPDVKSSFKALFISKIKRFAVKFNLMPKTMKGKVLLKKLFFGNMKKYPEILERDMFEFTMPVTLDASKEDTVHTALYAVCVKK